MLLWLWMATLMTSGVFGPCLEDIEMSHCILDTDKILSQSIKAPTTYRGLFFLSLNVISVPSATVLEL
jgi:hypothetical protein